MTIEYRNDDEDFTEPRHSQSDEDKLREEDNQDRAEAVREQQ